MHDTLFSNTAAITISIAKGSPLTNIYKKTTLFQQFVPIQSEQCTCVVQGVILEMCSCVAITCWRTTTFHALLPSSDSL